MKQTTPTHSPPLSVGQRDELSPVAAHVSAQYPCYYYDHRGGNKKSAVKLDGKLQREKEVTTVRHPSQ